MVYRNREEGLQYALWLQLLPAAGNRTKRRLAARAGTEEVAYRLKEGELKALVSGGILTQRQADHFLAWKKREPGELLAALYKRKIAYVPQSSMDYPERLKNIPDPPFGLFVKGSLPEEGRRSVAIVGARECSEYGREMACRFASAFAAAGVQVVSGLARGIDGISQKSALDAGGRSFGVLGCGVDVCYPAENRALFGQCMRAGGILSEYAPGVQPSARLFPARNRIISGLGDVLLVIEAREKSGTLITVDMALEQGREVFVLPGRVNDALSAGCNRLLAQGASMALTPEDILSYLGNGTAETEDDMDAGVGKDTERIAAFPHVPAGEEPQDRRMMVWEALDAYPRSFQQIYEILKESYGEGSFAVSELSCLLSELLMDGRIGEKGSCYYYRRNTDN